MKDNSDDFIAATTVLIEKGYKWDDIKKWLIYRDYKDDKKFNKALSASID